MSEGEALLSKAKMALQSHRAWLGKHSTSVLATAVYAAADATSSKIKRDTPASPRTAEDSGPKMEARKDARINKTSTTYALADPPNADSKHPTSQLTDEKKQSVLLFSPPRAQAWSTPTKEQLQTPSSSLQDEEESLDRKELAVDSSISSMTSDTSVARDEKGAPRSSLGPGGSEVPSCDPRGGDYDDEAPWLTSGTKVVCVSPAPSHLRADTTGATRSKLGITGDSVVSATWSKTSMDDGLYRRVIASSRDDASGKGSVCEMPKSTKRLVISLKAGEGGGEEGGGEEGGGEGGGGEEGGGRCKNSSGDGGGVNGEDVKRIGDVRHETDVFSGEGEEEKETAGAPQLGKQVAKILDIDPAMQLLVMSSPSTRGPVMNITLPHNPPVHVVKEPPSSYDSSPVLKMSWDTIHSHKPSDSVDPPALNVQDVFCGTKVSSKRSRATPPYMMHALGVGVASPSCPLYGVIQPTDHEFISVKPLEGASVVQTPNKPTERIISESVIKATSRSSMESDVSFPLKPSSAQDGCSSPSDTEEDLTQFCALSRMPASPGPLHLLARTGNLRRLQSAIEEGLDVNAVDHEGKTPLMYCVTDNGVHLSCADLLLKEGANLDHQSSDGSTALHVASYAGALSLIELMLLNGAHPDIRDMEGRLPLHWATKPRSPKCIATLLKNSNFDINTGDVSGMTPLMWACHFDNAPIVSYLLENGAELEEKDKDGLTAMHWAIHKNSVQCLQLLLKSDMTYFKDHNGLTVMHRAAMEGSMLACEHILTIRGDAFHDTDKKGRTPLHYAAVGSKVDVCAFLLDRGADVSQRDFSGHTPLDFAYIRKLDYVAALFLCHEASVADFARVSRSAISVSYASLDLSENGNNTDQTQMSRSTTLFKTLTEGTHPPSGFLGKYSNNGKGPLQHYCFWVDFQTKAICWSRYSNMRAPEVAQVQSVHSGASDVIKMRPDYSPLDINKYTFWVVTSKGVLDLTAYSEDKYVSWLTHLNEIAHDKLLGLLSSPQTTRPATATGVGIRHAWSTDISLGTSHIGSCISLHNTS